MIRFVYVLAIGLLALLPRGGGAQSASLSGQGTDRLDEQPRFPSTNAAGSSVEDKLRWSESGLEKFIKDNLKYPEAAKEAGFIPRIVRVGVTVEPDGTIHSPRIFQPGLKEYDDNAQAILVQMMQSNIKWIPGVSNGKPVRSYATIAIHYSLEGRNRMFPAYTADDDVYELVDKIPGLPTCQAAGKRDEWVRDCVGKSLQEFFARNLAYPELALKIGLEGDIQVEYVVGKNGQVRNVRLLNNLGVGCEEEVRRLFDLMNSKNIGWVPGEENGQKVDVVQRVTVPFRIPNTKTARAKVDFMDPKSLFITGREGFDEFMNSYLKYPTAEGVSPCSFGIIDVLFKIGKQNNEVGIVSMTDYNNLGKPFQDAIATFLQETNGLWKTAYPNLDEATTQYYISVPFTANGTTCTNVPSGYKETFAKAIDAVALTDKKSTFEDGIGFLDKAVRLFPADNKIRHLRGMALYKSGHTAEGCVDLFYINKQNKAIEMPVNCKK
jgi:Gram-negative bacterial TonB protein C-terminal